jgi:hypothetical protein
MATLQLFVAFSLWILFFWYGVRFFVEPGPENEESRGSRSYYILAAFTVLTAFLIIIGVVWR